MMHYSGTLQLSNAILTAVEIFCGNLSRHQSFLELKDLSNAFLRARFGGFYEKLEKSIFVLSTS
jgi:hypothetical protein